MAMPTPTGRRVAIMVAGAGVPHSMIDEILVPRGFVPVVTVNSIAELATRMRQLPTTLVVVPVQHAATNPEFAQLELELRRNPNIAAIGTAPAKDADLVLAAMRAGILEFLVSPPDPDELRTAIVRVLALSTSTSTKGRVYTVYSGKGGLGTSTLAAALSWELAHRPDKPKVALADFTTAGAGVRVMLNLTPSYDLGHISLRAEQIDRELVRSVMVKHPEQVSILAAAEEVDATDALNIQSATRLFEVMRQEYSHTVIDADHHFADPTLAALDTADRIMLVTQLDVSALRSTQRTLGVFARLGYENDKVALVVNRRSDRDRISVTDAEKVLGRPIDFTLPNDYASCSDAITHGQFLQKHAPASPLVASLKSVASNLTGSDPFVSGTQNGVPERSRLSRLFGKR